MSKTQDDREWLAAQLQQSQAVALSTTQRLDEAAVRQFVLVVNVLRETPRM